MVPANRMPYAGIADAGDRADLIAYLLKASQ
jgi:cytochrome c2